jgi:hypothetical protein
LLSKNLKKGCAICYFDRALFYLNFYKIEGAWGPLLGGCLPPSLGGV